MEYFGIDIGASGIKGSIVNLDTGSLKYDRFRLPTPKPATPFKVVGTINTILNHYEWEGPVGCGIPSVVKNKRTHTASNIHDKWIGKEVDDYFKKKTGKKFYCLNDADAAGIAMMQFGIGRRYQNGVVIMLTLGTGIGSAIFNNGILVPNTELGHLEFKGGIAENLVADSVRKSQDLSWREWGKRFNDYLQFLERIFNPDVFILGGGGSKRFSEYSNELNTSAPIYPSEKLNAAGIIGAAYFAHLQEKNPSF